MSRLFFSRKALIDGPSTGVKRSVRNFKDLHLTKFRIPLRHGMRTRNVKKAFDAEKISEKWTETSWAQKLAKKEIKAKMTDFDRFKLMRAKQLRNRLVRLQVAKLRKTKKAEKLTKGK
ncbi:60S ribosomal protein L14, variant [Loa loa]|uniref:Large ribosomal subunit protein eL14 n=1 Tax=Loa loa TaxID=7209 RepID=A0A1S0UFM9_LOALO|nr:60S ribosomal protein L14, variant [Loa loa]EJD74385.1 60S ribosomal protein L14, variant [Loa loa]